MHLTLVSEDSSLLIIAVLSNVASIRNVKEDLNCQLNILPSPSYFVDFHFMDGRVTTGIKHAKDRGFPS